MLIKAADDRRPDLVALEGLRSRDDLPEDARRLIDQEIRSIRADVASEHEAAYEIESRLGARDDRLTIHGLRLEVGEPDGVEVAEIDHLVVDQLLDIWVLETRGIAHGVAINDQGEWSAFYRRRIFPITSPVELSLRHVAVLDEVFRSGLVRLPTRDGITTEPALRPLVVVSNRARVRRPKKTSGGAIEGLETLITMGELDHTMDDDAEDRRLRSPDSGISRVRLHRLATELAALHVPLQVDWEARFGLR